MPTARIRRRIHSYRVLHTGFVRGRQLRFHKRSHDEGLVARLGLLFYHLGTKGTKRH
jgi:hypothetical protein